MAVFTQLRPKKLPRIDMRPEEFRLLIFTKGLRWTWQQAARCPCEQLVDLEGKAGRTGEPNPECPYCEDGTIYHSPQPVHAVSLGAEQDPTRFAIYGEMAKGMITLSLPPETVPGHLDRFVSLDKVMLYRERRTRRSVVERPSAAIVRHTQTQGDPADPTEPVEVTRGVLYCRRAVDGQVVGDELVEGADFTVTPAGEVDWSAGDAAGTAPGLDEQYALTYWARPSYIVVNLPYVHRETYLLERRISAELAHLPVKADCALEYYQLAAGQ